MIIVFGCRWAARMSKRGRLNKAEQALKRAVALAPAYAYPHWYLGNLLLRNARYDEAFAELRLASQADPELRPQQFNLVWAIYSDDPEGLKNAVGNTSAVRAAFALYLLTQQHLAEGLRLWDSLSVDDKIANRYTAEQIIQSLFKELQVSRCTEGLERYRD